MNDLFNRECIVRCGQCQSAVPVYWMDGNSSSKGGWNLRKRGDACPKCHAAIDLTDLKPLNCPHCGRLVEETPDGVCPNCNRVLQDLPEFDWDAMTDAFEDAQGRASYTAFASGKIALRVCDAKAFAQHMGIRPIQFSELTDEADDGLSVGLVRRLAENALYQCVVGLNGDSLDRLVPADIRESLHKKLDRELSSYGLRIRMLHVKEAKAQKTQRSQAKDLLRDLARRELGWQARGVRVHVRAENHLYADVDFNGRCRPELFYESVFFETPEIKALLSEDQATLDRTALTDLIQQRINGVLRTELAIAAQARIDTEEISDIMEGNQYVLALYEPMVEKLRTALNGLGLTVSEFRMELPEKIAPSPALDAQRQRRHIFICAQCGAELSAPQDAEKCVCPVCGSENDVVRRVTIDRQSTIILKCNTEGQSLIWKHPVERCARTTVLDVHENQEAVVFINYRLFRRYGPGRHALGDDANATENDAPHMTVYFVSKAAVNGLKWGTRAVVRDPDTGAYFGLGASGKFSLRVVDAVKLLNGSNGVAALNIRELLREPDGVTRCLRETVKEQSRSALAQAFRERRIGIRAVNAHLAEFSEAMKRQINQYLADYGVEMPEFIIEHFRHEPCAPSSLGEMGNNGIRRPVGAPVFQTGEITDDWKDIISAIDRGTAVSRYRVGAWKSLRLGNLGEIRMQLSGYNLDDRASPGSKAATTWLAMDLLPALYRMNPDANAQKMPSDIQYSANTGTVGGWSGSALRRYLSETVCPMLPDILQMRLVPVQKTQTAYDARGHRASQRTTDKLWIPDHHEVFGASALYYYLFQDSNPKRARPRQGHDGSESAEWWLRSAHSNTAFETVTARGEAGSCRAGHACGVLIGFCL